MLTRAITVTACVLLAACGPGGEDGNDMAGSSEAPEPAPATPAQSEPAEAGQAAGLAPTPAPEGASVYFIEPSDGADVSSPVRVVFGLEGAGVAPAGIQQSSTGHHHLLIDTEMPAEGQPIPSDDTHRHFGNGETEAEIELPPGSHTLQLLFADHLHIPHDPPIASERITINVQ